jgi:hypothetical protein
MSGTHISCLEYEAISAGREKSLFSHLTQDNFAVVGKTTLHLFDEGHTLCRQPYGSKVLCVRDLPHGVAT